MQKCGYTGCLEERLFQLDVRTNCDKFKDFCCGLFTEEGGRETVPTNVAGGFLKCKSLFLFILFLFLICTSAFLLMFLLMLATSVLKIAIK